MKLRTLPQPFAASAETVLAGSLAALLAWAGPTTLHAAGLRASDAEAGDEFGYAVSQSGSIGLVGAPNDAIGSSSLQGSAYLFRSLDTATGTITESVKLTASDGTSRDHFGIAVSQSGSIGLVGASGNGMGGSAYIFRSLDTATGAITQNVKLTASDGVLSDSFGFSVGLEGDQFVIGAFSKNSHRGKAYSGSLSSVMTLDAGSTSKTISGLSFVSQDDWIIGETTDSNEVTLSAGDTADVTAAGKTVFIGKNAGSDNNKLLIAGSLIARQFMVGAAGNTGNVLEAAGANALGGTGAITVNTGSTLLLSDITTTDRIRNSVTITMAGGTIAFSGNITEGTELMRPSPGTGALTLMADSIIDFGGGNDIINFGASGTGNPNPWTAGTTLSIYNWAGSPAGGGSDRLIFGSAFGDASLTAAQLGQISFFSGAGTGFLGTGEFARAFGEVVPEPSTFLGAVVLLGLARWREHRQPR